MVSLVKLGGSVLTTRDELFSLQRKTIDRLAAEIRLSGETPVVVHGTGRWGKAYARHYTGPGRTTRDSGVFQQTTNAIDALQAQIGRALRDEGVAYVRMPANAALRRDSDLRVVSPGTLEHLIASRVVPVLCGDVLVEAPGRFGIVSSDEILVALAHALPVTRCVFVTDVDGVLDAEGRLVEQFDEGARVHATDYDSQDVTGGMTAKVAAALDVARTGASVRIVNGLAAGRLRDALAGRAVVGTTVTAKRRPALAAHRVLTEAGT